MVPDSANQENRLPSDQGNKHLVNLFPFVLWFILVISVIIRIYIWYKYVSSSLIGQRVRVSNVVYSNVYTSGSKYIFNLSGILIQLSPDDKNLPEHPSSLFGMHLTVDGTLTKRSTSKNSGEFAVYEAIIVQISTPVTLIEKWGIAAYRLASRVRNYFGQSLGRLLPSREGAMLTGMLLGGAIPFDRDFLQQLRGSGLLHLIAASGYNITMVIAGMAGFTSLLFRRSLLKIIVTVITITMYVFIAETQASVIRAGTMGLIGYLVREIIGINRAAKRIFVAVSLLMVFVNPAWWWDVGFRLSVAATFGLLWIEPRIRSTLHWAIGGVSESLAATIATLPVVVVTFGWEQVSWAGIVTNIPASLLVGPAMILGATLVLVEALVPSLARILTVLGRPVSISLVWLVEFGAWLNGLIAP